jgi:sodium transport system permease protein
MRWSIVRLIWARELRDQLRDRRTLFMIAVLPVLLYPVAGLGLMHAALGLLANKHRVGVVNAGPLAAAPTPRAAVSWLAVTPAGPGGPLAAAERAAAALALAGAPGADDPPLFDRDGGQLRLRPAYRDPTDPADSLVLLSVGSVPAAPAREGGGAEPAAAPAPLRLDRSALDARDVDLLLVFPPDFVEQVRRGGRPAVFLIGREGDDRSRLTAARVAGTLARWRKQLKQVRLARAGLPADYDEPFEVRDPERAKPSGARAAEGLFDVLVRIFPFVLVMWSLAGALYPAVDLCAGEKERGTMETLLISPASREEIVWGKFLTIWVFSAATALLNLLSMGLTTWQLSSGWAGGGAARPFALAWGLVLLLPLSAFFSALGLAVGAYARSSKEGQYYLMPLFLLTMPLLFLTLAPGVELNPFYSMVPVTGVALLLQKLMTVGTPDGRLWSYFVPVLAPVVIYSWLALRWAIGQFQREEVLFREAERLDLRLWLARLLRDKEPLPSAGQAFFCFGLVLFLSAVTVNFGAGNASPSSQLVRYLAFVAPAPLFMALLLTSRPRDALALRRPPPWAWAASLALALLLFLPAAVLTLLTVRLNPGLAESVRELARSVADSAPPRGGPATPGAGLRSLLVMALLPAVCEELTFRGFVLSGLRSRFRPWQAVLLSSFLFALYRMNVFQALPHFLLGTVLAALVVRSGSVLPAVLFSLVHNGLTLAPLVFRDALGDVLSAAEGLSPLVLAAAALSAAAGGAVLSAVWFLPGRAGGRQATAGEGGGAAPGPPPYRRLGPAADLSRNAPS